MKKTLIYGVRSNAVKHLASTAITIHDVKGAGGGHVWSFSSTPAGSIIECHMLLSAAQDGMLCWDITSFSESELSDFSPIDCPTDMLNMAPPTKLSWRDRVREDQEQKNKQKRK